MTTTTQDHPGPGAHVHRGRAMGSTFVLEVVGDPLLLDTGRRRVAELEDRWSRFLPGSDIARCNATRGIPVFVHADTRRLVRHGIEAWQRTDGALDPTVLDALMAAGYDRSFADLDLDLPVAAGAAPPVPGCGGIEVDDHLGAVTLPRGTGFDPGAIGKGLAADLVAGGLIQAGADGVFVALGGDIRTAGRPAAGDGWLIEVHDPELDRPVASVAILDAGLATSTTRRRRWRRGGVDLHHVIDPRTGRPASGEIAQVTVLAGDTWWAEALATRLLLSARRDWARVTGRDGALIIDREGGLHAVGRMQEHLR